jgi:hypothetical protein
MAKREPYARHCHISLRTEVRLLNRLLPRILEINSCHRTNQRADGLGAAKSSSANAVTNG